MKWFEDSIEKKFRDRVLRASEGELRQLRSAAGRRSFFAPAAATLALALLALSVWSRRQPVNESLDADLTASDQDPGMWGELAIVEDLEFWQNLSLLEKSQELDEES